jgi:hypothetical protein
MMITFKGCLVSLALATNLSIFTFAIPLEPYEDTTPTILSRDNQSTSLGLTPFHHKKIPSLARRSDDKAGSTYYDCCFNSSEAKLQESNL